MTAVAIGHDSEVFAKDIFSGEFRSFIGLIGGDKDHPVEVPGGNMQEDNMSGEIAVNSSPDAQILWDRTQICLSNLRKVASQNKLQLVITPSVEFSMEVVQGGGRKAVESGCDPDFNTYTDDMNEIRSYAGSLVRFGSGHLHIDCSTDADTIARAVRWCDFLIKAPLMAMYGLTERDQSYGAMGNFRYKSYGFEYRSTGNEILLDKEIFKKVVARAQSCSHKAMGGLAPKAEDLDDLRFYQHQGDLSKIIELCKARSILL